MTLRVKLIGGFFLVALITLLVSAVGFWQTRKLASALYDVGAVRLPSVSALDRIFEAKTALDASKRELIRETMLFDGGPNDQSTPVAWNAWKGALQEELHRQQQAWTRAETGWKAYEGLPRTTGEESRWIEFIGAWNAWRTSYQKVMTLLSQAAATEDRSLLVAARAENDTNLYDPARQSRLLLNELLQINEELASTTKQQSVANHRDVRVVGYLMLGAALASVAAAIGCGMIMSRLIGRPITEMAGAFSRIAQGDLNTQVPVGSRDEIGQMAAAMNHMVDSLRTSESRFRAVFENSIDAIGVSKDDRMILANPALLTLFGYNTLEEVAGRAVFDFLAPESHRRLIERSQLRKQGKTLPSLFELTGLKKDGKTFTMEVQTARFALQGETYVVAVQRDVTERKRAAALLQESNERLELALRTSKLGVWRRHLTTDAAEWDDRMFEIFGLPRADRPPTRAQIIDMVVPEDRELALRAWNAVPDPSRTYLHRFRLTRTDGAVRHLEVHAVVHNETGRPLEWSIGVTGDITEIVAAAEESTRLREQLVQAQKLEALGTLSAGIAHDFNNMLTGINGFIELAATTLPAGHEAGEMLKRARRGTVSARELVRRILTFSRQAHSSERTPVNLGVVTREIVSLIYATLPTNVSLSSEIAPDLPDVIADSGQIQQVLINLCTNGAHAIGRKKGMLRIHLDVAELPLTSDDPLPTGCRSGPHVCLAVSDTGDGMDEATVKRIFQPFFTTKKPGEGTGLGLAIVRDIVNAHEAGIAVSSTPGQGTTFRLYFPIHVGELKPATTDSQAGLPQLGAEQRIMVVDDDPSISRVVQLALQKGGYQPEEFNSPIEAWSRFEKNPEAYQLLIIDQQMSVLSGSDFVSRARTLVPTLPVVMMSGRFEHVATNAQDKTAPVGQLKKPFGIAELLELVASTLAS